MTKMMTNTTYETKVSILANTYHFEFGEDFTELGEFFDDFSNTCVLAISIEDGLCIPTDKGKASVEFAFDSLCEQLDIQEDTEWTDFQHWNSQFAE